MNKKILIFISLIFWSQIALATCHANLQPAAIYSRNWENSAEHNLDGQALFGDATLVDKGIQLSLAQANFSAVSPQFTPPLIEDNFTFEAQFTLENFQVGDSFEFRYYFFANPDDQTANNAQANYFYTLCQAIKPSVAKATYYHLNCRNYTSVLGVNYSNSTPYESQNISGANRLPLSGGIIYGQEMKNGQRFTLRLHHSSAEGDYPLSQTLWPNQDYPKKISLYSSFGDFQTTTANLFPPALVLSNSQATAKIILHQFTYATPTSSHTIAMEPMQQNDPRWSNLHLGQTEMVGEPQTIGEIGCALASAAMIFNSYGYHYLPDGSELNPDGLNFWLQHQPDGFFQANLLNWLALTRLSTQLHQFYQQFGENLPKFEFRKVQFSAKRDNQLNLPYHISDLISHGEPVIVEIPGHFVVANQSDLYGRFSFLDPYFANRHRLSDYPKSKQQILSLRRFVPSFTDQSYLVINVTGSTDVTVKNSQGETLALETNILEEPTLTADFSKYLGKQFLLAKPANDVYQITISTPYTDNKFNILSYNQEAQVTMFAPQDIVIDEDGENIELTFFKESPDNFAVFVDKNQHHSYWELWGSSYDWPNQFVRLQFDLLIQQEKFATAQIFLQDYLQRHLITANLYNQLCNFIQSNL